MRTFRTFPSGALEKGPLKKRTYAKPSVTRAISRPHRSSIQQDYSIDEIEDGTNRISESEDYEGEDYNEEFYSDEDYNEEYYDEENYEEEDNDDNSSVVEEQNTKPGPQSPRQGESQGSVGSQHPNRELVEPNSTPRPGSARLKTHSVQNTISDDRTQDSDFQRKAILLTALDREKKIQGSKDQDRPVTNTKLADSNNGESQQRGRYSSPAIREGSPVVKVGSRPSSPSRAGAGGNNNLPPNVEVIQVKKPVKKNAPLAWITNQSPRRRQNRRHFTMASGQGIPHIPHHEDEVAVGPSAKPEPPRGFGLQATTNSKANLIQNPAFNDCFRLISQALNVPQEYARNLESLQAYISGLNSTTELQSREPRFQMVYRVEIQGFQAPQRMYLDPPQWMEGANSRDGVLAGNLPIRDIPSYLEKNPEVCFIVYRNYSVSATRKDGFNAATTSKHRSEAIETTTADLTTAVAHFMRSHGFRVDAVEGKGKTDTLSRPFAGGGLTELAAPYPAIYHIRGEAMDSFLASLDTLQEQQFRLLLNYIISHYEEEYVDAEEKIANGRIPKHYLKYLFKPGDVVVQRKANQVRGFLCGSWVTEKYSQSDKKTLSRREAGVVQYTIKAHHWTFDGVFSCKVTDLSWEIDASNNSDLEIDGLSICPLAYVNENLAHKLRHRGEWVWKCRKRYLVSYHEDSSRELHYAGDERYMIDMMAYRELHKPEMNSNKTRGTLSEQLGTDDLGPEAMERDEPPSDEFLYLLPETIKGFNLRKKKWVDLEVDKIGDVVWNTRAFESLVLEGKTKRLIQALISDQIETERSTDLISGKGNGLILLLHGGPGTGKTLTAESVAEIARKPLYPVTCGDIGTEPEEVETYLESVLHLGKIWECVVLLDEADVFLEQRSLEDLRRNALVSVFLRVLEYYDGILVLTSNRVGTFDEAFKSRIQLAIHYKNLTVYQRIQIWTNFIRRLKELDEKDIDFTDLEDHVEQLASFKMNGREIRNVITIARQYARWERKQRSDPENYKLNYKEISSIIETAGEFDQYIKKLKGGYTDDQIAESEGLRLAKGASSGQ
ncbi:hypothetical protein F5Y13DRAFT_156585 [Hypoxylon sp. FL1857]|nr:hypothetical protein F5Y13DRAFT_156585 [Hypoxylon sp. FL1857]